jgi:hypothetical protein
MDSSCSDGYKIMKLAAADHERALSEWRAGSLHAGEIHTSSLNKIHEFDARKYKNRQLVVHHRNDGCYLAKKWILQGG